MAIIRRIGKPYQLLINFLRIGTTVQTTPTTTTSAIYRSIAERECSAHENIFTGQWTHTETVCARVL